MSLSIGIVGLPNVGKSTLFNALIKNAKAEAALAPRSFDDTTSRHKDNDGEAKVGNFPFTTIEPNVGIVTIADERLNKIAELENSQTRVPTSVKFIDIAGLIRGAHKGEGLGNKFLAHIREVDAICLVARAFLSADTVHVEGSIDPRRDIDTIIAELALADLQVIDKIKGRMADQAKSQDEESKEARATLGVISKIEPVLNESRLVSAATFDKDELELINRNLPLLTIKPMILILNVDEKDAALTTEQIHDKYKLSDLLPAKTPMLAICARAEAAIANLPESEKQEYLAELGLKEPGLERLARQAYSTLNLITFFTAGPNESRAWTITKGDSAYDAAGKIHTDFQKKFIRAEVVGYDDFIACGSWHKSGEAGKFRLEGKNYIVSDGDLIFFRHS